MVYILVVTVLIAVFIYAAYQLTVYFIQTVKAKQEEQMIRELIVENESLSTSLPGDGEMDKEDALFPSPVITAPPTAAPSIAPSVMAETDSNFSNKTHDNQKPEVLIEFLNPLSINPDTVGQLKLGETINTYVVQRDNAYYLRHSYSGEYSFSGAVFMDVTCSIYPRSRNLIIHGHNMQNGTAFGKLLRYEKLEYLNQYPVIYFSTLYESANYLPFSVVFYSIDPKSEDYIDLYQVNYLSDQDFLQFIKTVQAMSVYHIPVCVSKTDEIITLTTCATDDPNMRFAIFAVKK